MITVKYSCKSCGIIKRDVQVPARESESRDVVHWVQHTVIQCVKDDHERQSPLCPSQKCDVMIPAAGEFIGQQVE